MTQAASAQHARIQELITLTERLTALLAERVEGIASVAHALAFCHAIETIAGCQPPPAAGLVRVLHAEFERIANHLDVAVRLADAAGLAVATARFALHKERVQRLVSALCGSRFGRGVVAVPPRALGAAADLLPNAEAAAFSACELSCHAYLALPLAALPALRRMFSPR